MRDDARDVPITPTLLLQGYAAGIFPMAEDAGASEIYWVDPKRRGVLPLDGLHVSRSLKKAVVRAPYEIRVDSAFSDVVAACGAREETWINGEIARLYTALFRMGYAHSVEAWQGDRLVGGLYGVSLGGAFFGESMFSTATDASKIALVYLVARLRFGGFQLLDTQFVTDHLARLGVVEIPRAAYRAALAAALPLATDFHALDPALEPHSVLQFSTQTS